MFRKIAVASRPTDSVSSTVGRPVTLPGSQPTVDAPAPMRPVLEDPITWLVIRLAAPNLTPFAAVLVLVSVDAIVIGRLGRDALAGLSLVFPLVMLSQSMAAGGLGSAVASAVARALGGGDRQRARSLALHGLLIGLAISAGFGVLVGFWGRSLFIAMGARDDVLEEAVAYATIVFIGAPAPWLLNVTASIARGTGDMKRPAIAMALSAASYIALAPVLTVGVGAWSGLGIRGTALAFIASYTFGTVVIVQRLLASEGAIDLRPRWFPIDRSSLKELLGVGMLGGTNAALSSLTALVATAFVGHLGPGSLAGYGLGTRVEYVVIPLSFAFGTALVTIVGANIGVGNVRRARKAAWIGAGLSAATSTVVGTLAALFPSAWLERFTSDEEILHAGAVYLRTVGPFYGFFGLGLALYFASIGAGRPGLPVAVTVIRLVIVAAGMSLGAHSLESASVVLALAFAAYGVLIAVGTRTIPWRPPGA